MWGTTTVGGVEVFNLRQYYYTHAHRSDNFEELFKFLKTYEDVKDYDGKGVNSAWFYLNKNNGPDGSDVASSYYSDNLNSMWWDYSEGVRPENLTLTTSIIIGGRFDGNTSIETVDWTLTKEQIIQSVKDNYEALWTTNSIIQEGIGVINKGSIIDPTYKTETPDEDDLSPDDPWLAILARYALRTDGIPCTIKDVEVGLSTDRIGRVSTTTVVTLEIPYIRFLPGNLIINSIVNDMSETNFPTNLRVLLGMRLSGSSILQKNENVTQALAKQVSFYETVDDIDLEVISRDYLTWDESTLQVSVYDNLWFTFGGITYLRADIVDTPLAYGIKQVDLNKYLFSLFDTGYKKKKVKWYKKALAIVVFVVAVVITVASLGSATWITGPIMLAAVGVVVGALVISLVTATLSALNINDWASAFAWTSKLIEPLVLVANIILVVNSIVVLAEQVAAQGLSVVSEIALDTLLDGLGEAVFGEVTTMTTVRLTTAAVDMYTNVQLSKIENISDRIKDNKAEYDRIIEETSMTTDIMRGFMNIYPKPATADWSIYSGTYDAPYESGGGVLSTGCVQKTTKQALRKADYDDAVFKDMVLV